MPIKGEFRVTPVDDVDNYEVGYIGAPQTVAPGASLTQTTHVFAGAKVVPLLRATRTPLGLPKFDQAVDWGNFWFLTQPLFSVLELLQSRLPGHDRPGHPGADRAAQGHRSSRWPTRAMSRSPR